jgi:signal peptidase
MPVNIQTIGVLRQVVQNKGEIELPAQGDSMFPFIREKDVCTFVQCDSSQLKKGDIVLFYSEAGQLIAHRLYDKYQLGNQSFYVFKGDTNFGFDKPVPEQKIIGKLVRIEKEILDIKLGSWYSVGWSKIIISSPIFSSLIRRYLNWRVGQSINN